MQGRRAAYALKPLSRKYSAIFPLIIKKTIF
jgi:hypothetical protein